jgi:hypothetical protein
MRLSTAFLLLCAVAAPPLAADDSADAPYWVAEAASAWPSPIEADFVKFQPRGTLSTPAPRAADLAAAPRRTGAGGSYARLARVPNMFGDSLPPTTNAFICDCRADPANQVVTELLTGGGSRYTPISENNRPLPTDRVFFVYNGFNNAVTTTSLTTGDTFDSDLQRYTMGFEKTFLDGWASIEMRLPLLNSIDIQTPGNFSSSGNVGNLTLIYKQLLMRSDDTAIAAGMGLGLPTGDQLTGRSGSTNFSLGNQATYLLPYLGLMHTVGDNVFLTAFTQIDIAAGGDDFNVQNRGTLGKLNAPTFARFDLGGGYWLIRDPGLRYVTGVALISEVHYLTTLSDADSIINDGVDNDFALAGADNRVDYLNLTMGVHWQITPLANLRVSGVFPMRPDPNRQFDSELQMSFNRNF